MFRKYEKTFRIDSPEKRSLTSSEISQLFSGKVVVEEKLDGANTGIIRHKKGFHLQKRGSLVGQSEHHQFQFFHAWANNTDAYLKIMDLPVGYIVYGELLRCIHTIYYDQLPDWFVIFDVWDGEKYLDRFEKQEFCNIYEFALVPLIVEGYYSLDEIKKLVPVESKFGSVSEGVVIKKYHKKHKNFMKGKIIHPQFYEKMDEKHWSTLPIRYNKLANVV